MGQYFHPHRNGVYKKMNNNKIVNSKEKSKKNRQIFLDKAYKLIDDGVYIHDPYRLDIRGSLICGDDVEIDINVIIEGKVVLDKGVKIGANSILKDCRIGKNTIINPFSLIENSIVGDSTMVGPYGRIRPGNVIGDFVQIGNFVEIKNSNIASKCRINHLAFVGDADLAGQVTIGAGVITCNHDGFGINRTTIEQGAYVGSGCNLVAPLMINANATIASGSTITEEVAADTLTIARSRQVTIENWKKSKLRK
jgi:bifunctional UDP-N-acetylglucosamine pyrophosphorylase / glucosamine-1-phosphate N-acetyltransferase